MTSPPSPTEDYLGVLQNGKYGMSQNTVHGVEEAVLPGLVEEYVVYGDPVEPRDGKRNSILILRLL